MKREDFKPGEEVYHVPTQAWYVVFDQTAGKGKVRLQDDKDQVFTADIEDCERRSTTNGGSARQLKDS
jgi:hypothetical protein